MKKKILVGSGAALALFLATIFLFGSRNAINVSLTDSTAPLAGDSENTPALLKPEKNLTKALSDQLIENITAENKNSYATADSPAIAIDANSIVEETLKKQVDNFNYNDIWPIVDEKKITVLTGATAADDSAYLKAMLTIFSSLTTSSLNPDNMEDNDFTALAEAREKAFNSLYATPVPEDLLDIHLRLLDLLGAQRNIYVLVANYKNDPLKALLALQFQKELFNDGQATETDLSAYIKEHKLN